jgi:hypothetical protein
MKALWTVAVLMLAPSDQTCESSTDDKVAAQQAQTLEQAHAQVGMPSFNNFEEKRMAKDIYELRDKAIATHTYIVNEMGGCLVYLGPSVGYGLPYATQYSAPTHIDCGGSHACIQVPQAEPNGLFMPAAADGTWILMKDPVGDKTLPVYVEPRVLVSPFRLPDNECKKSASQK